MKNNDRFLLDNIISERVSKMIPSSDKGEVFEFLTYQQKLKDYDLSIDELLSGSVDGRNDGGIDAIFIFLNGHLIIDNSAPFFPKSNAELEIYFFSCKHSDSFKQEPVNSIIASLQELLDFSLTKKDMCGDYNEDIYEKRNLLIGVFKKIGAVLTSLRINIIYACRGDTRELGENIISRGKQAETLCNTVFSGCKTHFLFYGCSELLVDCRKVKNYSSDLPFLTYFSQGEQYVLLSTLRDYYNFITDADGKLKKHLFDSNVRDYMGINSVNEDILNTLDHHEPIDFWWLNNGITIISTGVIIVGKTMTIQNVQIVNGLQTSECIYRYFSSREIDDDRNVLIKVLTSQDKSICDCIIRATNNQTEVQASSLHATDKIQRDIEDILLHYDMYYERRINYYSNQGIPNHKIYSPIYLASGYRSLIGKRPEKGVTTKSKLMRNPKEYEKVFSEQTSLEVWPRIAYILRTTDRQMEKERTLRRGNVESFLKCTRHLVSLITLARILGKFDYSIPEFAVFELSNYTEEAVHTTWEDLKQFLPEAWDKYMWKKAIIMNDIISKMADLYKIPGAETVVNRGRFRKRK